MDIKTNQLNCCCAANKRVEREKELDNYTKRFLNVTYHATRDNKNTSCLLRTAMTVKTMNAE